MTEPTEETGRPLDEQNHEEAPEDTLENPTEELPELSDEQVVVHPELARLEALERHAMLTNAEDANRLAEIRGEDSNGEANA